MLTVKINEYSYPLLTYYYNISYGEDQQIINNTMRFEIVGANQRVEELQAIMQNFSSFSILKDGKVILNRTKLTGQLKTIDEYLNNNQELCITFSIAL